MRMKTKTLKEVIQFKNGKKRPIIDGNIPVYGGNGVLGYANNSNYERCIIIGRVGAYCGSVYLEDNKCWVSDNAIAAQPLGENDIRFLYYLLKGLRLNERHIGTSQPLLTQEILNKIECVVPSPPVQKRIAALLGSFDDKISANKRINDNLERQVQAYFQELFVDNADPAWTLGTISDLGTVVGGSTPSKSKPEYYTEDGIAWITPKDLSINKAKFISHGENDITELGLKNSSASIMPEGTVLFSSRAPIGYIAIASGEVTTNQGFKSVVPKPEIGTAYVYCFLKHTLPVIEGMASGSTFKEVSGSTMKNVPAVIPDTETLTCFNEFCAPIFAQQRILEEQNQSLAALRDSLLPKLMSGELDVSGIQL